MDSPVNTPARIPTSKVRSSVLVHGLICCALYIGFLLLMKLVNLWHITELRFLNYVILFFIGGVYQIKKWIHERKAYVHFLQVFGTVFFTGIWSFFLFSIFLWIWGSYDQALSDLFSKHTSGFFLSVPYVAILFEGSAISIIVAFINMQYFRRFEEGEEEAK